MNRNDGCLPQLFLRSSSKVIDLKESILTGRGTTLLSTYIGSKPDFHVIGRICIVEIFLCVILWSVKVCL